MPQIHSRDLGMDMGYIIRYKAELSRRSFMDLDEILEVVRIVVFLFLGIMMVVFLLALVLNPYFWQGLRNSKFIDKLKKQEPEEMIKP